MAGRKTTSNDKPPSEESENGFLGRWSRRKAEAKTAEETRSKSSPDLHDGETPSDLAARQAEPAAAETVEPPAFDVASLPDIDSLGPGSDFSMFMQTGVPSELKNRALRKLWRVKPELANLDGLLDYGEDLTGSFKVVDHLKTAYEVGRGFLRDEDDLRDKDDETEKAGERAKDGHEAAEIDLSDSEKPEERQLAVDNVDVNDPEADQGK